MSPPGTMSMMCGICGLLNIYILVRNLSKSRHQPGTWCSQSCSRSAKQQTWISKLPFALEKFGSARRARPSHPASSRSLRTLRLSPALTGGLSFLQLSETAYVYYTINRHRVYHVTQLRTDCDHHQALIGTGPIVLTVARVIGTAYSVNPVDEFLCVCVLCFLPIHSGHQVRWTYRPGSHRRKVTQDF